MPLAKRLNFSIGHLTAPFPWPEPDRFEECQRAMYASVGKQEQMEHCR
jgi:hypothetical protein